MELIPKNELETALIEFYNQDSDFSGFSTFINTLINQPISILAQNEPKEQAVRDLDIIKPLIIQGKSGEKYLVVLTEPERFKPLENYSEEYPVMFTVDAKALFTLLPEDVGLVINPGYDCFQSFKAEVIAPIRHQLTEIRG